MNYRQAAAVAHLQALAGRGAEATRDESPETLALIQDEKIAALALTENPLHVLRQGHRVRLAAILIVGVTLVGVQFALRPSASALAKQAEVASQLEEVLAELDFLRSVMVKQLGATQIETEE